jgi:hypothetical protein
LVDLRKRLARFLVALHLALDVAADHLTQLIHRPVLNFITRSRALGLVAHHAALGEQVLVARQCNQLNSPATCVTGLFYNFKP